MTDEIRTTKLATQPRCPVCRKLLDGATGHGTPDPESLTVCVYCGVFLSFTAEMDLRLLTEDEWKALPRETRAQLAQYLEITRQLRQPGRTS